MRAHEARGVGGKHLGQQEQPRPAGTLEGLTRSCRAGRRGGSKTGEGGRSSLADTEGTSGSISNSNKKPGN